MDKKLLRKEIINRRDSIDKSYKVTSDKTIKQRLISEQYYKNSRVIFIYIGFGSEIDTTSYIQYFINDGKRVCVPRTDIKSKTMEAIEITSLEGLEENKYGILEPISVGNPIDKDQIDLIVMPGVVFDRNGGRVGYGGGYYDKYIESLPENIIKVALAYKFQVIDKVPMEKHDVRVDYLITD